MKTEFRKSNAIPEEQETTINIDPVAGTASVYSSVPATVKELQKIADSAEATVWINDIYGFGITIPAEWVSIAAARGKMQISDEERQKRRDRAAKARANKKL